MRLAVAVLLCWSAVLAWPSRGVDAVRGPRPTPVPRRSPFAGHTLPARLRARVRDRTARRRRAHALVGALDALAAGLDAGLPAEVAVRESVRATDDPVLREAFLYATIQDTIEDGYGETAPCRPSAGGAIGGGRPDGIPAGDDPRARARARARAGAGADPETEARGMVLLSRAWWLSHRLGTPLAESVRAVAVLLRADMADSGAVTVAMSEARATVVVLVALPVLGPLFAAASGLSPLALYGSPAALGCLALGLLCLAVGGWWMRVLLRQVARAGESS